jgi:MbtH protein
VAKRVAAGEFLKNGTIAPKAFGDYDGEARDVLRRWYPSFLGTAGGFYGNFDFPAVQLYWPDKAKLFPWQSGFNSQLFQYQPILYQDNLVLANVGYEEIQRLVHEEGPQVLETSLADLLVTPDDVQGDLIGDWRWRVGPAARLYQVTLFGDLFLKTPDGHIHWLDTGADLYEDVAADREGWLRALCDHAAAFLHPSTLLHLRSLGYLPKKGQVYSWIKPPLVGGEDTVDNFDTISTVVHISHLGRMVQAVKAQGTEAHGAVPEDDKTLYTVVVNDEKQYSIWPTGRELPSGWKSTEKTGTQKECLDYIAKVWVDLRPESLRQKREQEKKAHP